MEPRILSPLVRAAIDFTVIAGAWMVGVAGALIFVAEARWP